MQERCARARERTPAQLAPNYNLSPAYPWGVNYFALNYTNPTTGPIFKQLYIRQAMQSLHEPDACGSSSTTPATAPRPTARCRCSRRRNRRHVQRDERTRTPTARRTRSALLKSHGWTVVPGWVTTPAPSPGTGATSAAQASPRARQLNFNYLYYNGAVSFNNQIKEMADDLGAGRHQADPRGQDLR